MSVNHEGPSAALTNDLRYESKDSRDIENGSFSLRALRAFEEVVVEGDLSHTGFCFSVGDG